MASPAPETDKKKALASAVQKPGAKDAASPGIAREKTALGAMLRPDAAKGGKLEVGGKGEPAEKEADKVADAVLKDAPAGEEVAKDKKAKDKKDGEEPAPGTPLARGPPTLTIVADTTLRRTTAQGGQPHLDSLSAEPALPGNMSDVSVAAAENADLDDLEDGDYSRLSQGESLRPRFLPGHGRDGRFPVSRPLARQIRATSGGSPLPGALRARIEDRLALDLSAVRVHAGADATRLCQAFGARAFAHGRNIWLRSPAEAGDARLMSHEVAHTIQQGAARLRPVAAAPRRDTRPHPGTRPHPDTRPHPGTRRRSRPQAHPRQTRAPPPGPAPPQPAPATIRRLEASTESEDAGFFARKAEGLADRLDSYGVLKVLVGRRLFTGQTVNPSATDYVGAFMTFIGAGETFQQMKQSGSLQKGFDQIKAGLSTHDISWERVKRTFDQAYDEFEWTSPIDSFTRIFGPFFADIAAYGIEVLKIIAELVAEAFVISFGPMGVAVWEKIKAIGDTINLIIADPMQFAKRLISAIGLGIEGFGQRIWEHIKAGLLAWVLGPLIDMGITMPAKLDLKGIVSVILQVLGLSYPQLRPRIVKALNPNGEVKVGIVEKLIEVVNILRTEGLAGIWRKLMEYVDNLQTTVINGIRDWVVRAVVQAGIRKLVAWSNPAGALIDILLTIYNLIVFFVERFQQILDFAASVFDSLGKIARGELGDAALAVEKAMAQTIPIIISFLVRLLGLPDIGGTVRKIITDIRARVHAAVDRVLTWIVDKVKKLIAGLVSRFKRDRGTPQNSVVMQGLTHAMSLDESGGRRRLMIRSEATELTADYVDGECRTMAERCTEPITTTLLPKLQACALKLRALETAEKRTAGQPQPNRDTPAKAKERDGLLAEIKTLIEAGTDKSVLTKEEQDSGEVVADKLGAEFDAEAHPPREDQKDQVKADLNGPIFRFVILNDTAEGEGFAGPWAKAQATRTSLQKEIAESGSNAKYLIELDHNPEWAILKRLGNLETDPDEVREGEAPKPPEPVFPTLKAQFSADISGPADKNRDAGHGLLAVATRREVNGSELNKQDENWRTFDQLAKWDPARKRFRYKPGKAAEAPKNADWIGKVQAAAEGHQAELLTNYDRYLAVHDTAQETVDAVRTNGASIIATTSGILGNTVPEGEMLGGAKTNLSGVGMRGDPVEAELTEGPSYNAAVAEKGTKAPTFGRSLQTHHMIEQSVLEAIREETTSVRAFRAIGEDFSDLPGFARSAPAPKETLAAALKDKTTADGAAVNAEAEFSKLIDGRSYRTHPTVFPEKDILGEGYAVNVLLQVNQLAGSTPKGTSRTAIRTARNEPLNRMVEAFDTSITTAYGAVQADDASPDALTSARKTAQGTLNDHISGTLTAELRAGFRAEIDIAAGRAFDRFRPIQNTSLERVRPKSPDDPEFTPAEGEATPTRRDVFKGLLNRDTQLTRDKVVQANRQIWAA